MTPDSLSRRELLAAAALASIPLLTRSSPAVAAEVVKPVVERFQHCTFVKFLQSLSYAELGEKIRKTGLTGVEFPVRAGGKILPENAVAELPKAVKDLRSHGVDMTIMTTDIVRADQKYAEETLKTAADLGIKQFRLGYYRYDLKRQIQDQLGEFAPQIEGLAKLCDKIGIQGIYQNHAGPTFLGSGVWDLCYLLRDIPKEQIGIAFDIRHAAIDCGTSWKTVWNLVQPHLASVFVKNAVWQGLRAKDVPLGTKEGMVDPFFYSELVKSSFAGSLSLHVEYLEKEPVEAQLTAIERDQRFLLEMLGQAAGKMR